MTTKTTDPTSAARIVLRHNLRLSTGDNVLLVGPEERSEELMIFARACKDLKLGYLQVVIPTSLQYSIRKEEALPRLLRDAVPGARGMVLLTEYSAASTPFRMSLLEFFRDRCSHGRAVSLPGVTVDEFPYFAKGQKQIDRDAEALAHILLRTSQLKIKTVSRDGREHFLQVPTKGMFPSACGTRVPQGDWDNVPTGETFILPTRKPQRFRRETTGSIVIDGSIPKYVLNSDTGVEISVRSGKIDSITSPNPQIAKAARSLFFKNYRHKTPVARNSTVLSEVGFGVNPAIKHFYGVPIFDEKIAGTIHIAFGKNDQLGGDIHGKTHHDIVTRCPDVYVDIWKDPIVSNGRLNLPQALVEPNWITMTEPLRPSARIRDLGFPVSFNPVTNGLTVEWIQSVGSRMTSRVGDAESSVLAATAYRELQDHNYTVAKFLELMKEKDIPRDPAMASLRLLVNYGLIAVSGR